MGSIDYAHRLTHYAFDVTCRPVSMPAYSGNSFARWAPERYCLYCQNRKGFIYRTEVQHPKWTLESAELTVRKK